MKQPPPPDTTRLFLVRHGATTANENRPYILQGRNMDLDLSELGRRQAEAVGALLADYSIDRIYSSPLVRARQTAEAIAKHHPLTVTAVEEVTECDVGRWEGQGWDAIMRDDAEAYRLFIADPSQHPYAGGETYADVWTRAQPAINRILEDHAGHTIVLVAHNVVNRVYLANLLGIELRRAKDVRQSNACVNVIRHRHGETQLLTLNALFHLDGLIL